MSAEAPRKCPRCHEEMLKVLLGQPAITIDRCARCSGEFYDAGEIEATTEAACDAAELQDYVEAHVSRRATKPSVLSCSACHAVMMACEITHAEKSFEIDQCPCCRGIWLDEDEPRRLRDMLAALADDSHRPSGLFGLLWLFRFAV